MTQIKIFQRAGHHDTLQRAINDWLEQNPSYKIVKIHIQPTVLPNCSTVYDSWIQYEK